MRLSDHIDAASRRVADIQGVLAGLRRCVDAGSPTSVLLREIAEATRLTDEAASEIDKAADVHDEVLY